MLNHEEHMQDWIMLCDRKLMFQWSRNDQHQQKIVHWRNKRFWLMVLPHRQLWDGPPSLMSNRKERYTKYQRISFFDCIDQPRTWRHSLIWIEDSLVGLWAAVGLGSVWRGFWLLGWLTVPSSGLLLLRSRTILRLTEGPRSGRSVQT